MTPESKRPLKVFLCHAHADRDAVRGLYSRLTQDGVDAWLDKEKLLPGQDWELEIRKAVREADVVVVCLSKQFNQAGFRQKEVRLALDTAMEKPEGEIFIIPARLEECENLESLKKWHWVDLFEVDGYEELLRALYARAEKIDAILQFMTPIGFALSGRLMELEGQALRAEIMGDLWLARKTWYEIKQITPSFPRVDIKIKELERELRLSSSAKICPSCGNWIPANTRYCSFCGRNYFTQMKSWEEKRLVIGAISLLLIVCIVVWLLRSPLIEKWFPPIPIVTETATITLTSQSIIPSNTIEPSQTPTENFTLTLTSSPTETTDTKGVSMIYVPEGEFTMGNENGDKDQQPVHQVYLDAFYIDKYEVTNALYKACVDEGACTIPRRLNSSTRSSYYGDLKYDIYPMINVDWNQARTYCEWRGAKLPTEAQWEKAARGTDGRTYPWGEGISCSQANYRGCISDTNAVGSYVGGVGLYGAYDMAGNVWEWVQDWYSAEYYVVSPNKNPLGPESGTYHVVRGGAWDFTPEYVTVSDRFWGTPDSASNNFGFRCAKDATP
jgi:formylglycine-generating enzyme required for sulfatase activity